MEKLEVLLNDEAFLDKMMEATTLDELGKLFSENGVEMSQEELCEFAKEGKRATALSQSDGELTEDALEDVSGGGAIFNWIRKKLNNYGKKKGEQLDNYWEKLIYSYVK